MQKKLKDMEKETIQTNQLMISILEEVEQAPKQNKMNIYKENNRND